MKKILCATDGTAHSAHAVELAAEMAKKLGAHLSICVVNVANGGTVYYPRLVDRLESGDPLSEEAPSTIRPGQVRSRLETRPEYLAHIRAAMRDDVLDTEGTGTSARVTDYTVCGKTGTAEIKGNGVKDKVTSPSFTPHLLMVALLSITRSFIRYIQSSNCTFHTRPSTGRAKV